METAKRNVQMAEQPDGVTQTDHDRARRAATGAFVGSRKRADSSPAKPEPSTMPFAVSAAGISHRARHEEENPLDNLDNWAEASRIHHVANTNAQLYTSTPPVAIERDEQNKANVMRAASVSMARDMIIASRERKEGRPHSAVYGAHDGANAQQSRRLTTVSDAAAVHRALSLQGAAEKLAADKIASMDEAYDNYPKYYGTASSQRGLSLRRRRTSTPDGESTVDAERSREIRDQMSSLQNRLDEVDEQKEKDRALLLQAARRNVDAQMHDMELRVYAETGRAPQAMQKDLDDIAVEEARSRRETESRLEGDRVAIGADQYMDRADVDAIARARIQPELDEINERAENKKTREIERTEEKMARKIEARLDENERKRRAAVEREREESTRAMERRLAGEESHGKREKRRSFMSGLFKKKASKQEAKTNGVGKHDIRQEEPEVDGTIHTEREDDVQVSGAGSEREPTPPAAPESVSNPRESRFSEAL